MAQRELQTQKWSERAGTARRELRFPRRMSFGQLPIGQLIGQMTMAEKIGQMTQASNESISPSEVADFSIGSVLSGGNGNPTPNTPSVWAEMVASVAEGASGSRLGIPLIYGVDAVHGHSNVKGATVFPHNIGLGAVGDPELVERIGRATALEMMATGVRWAFAPTVAVPQDIRWGRTYEGYGRDPELVATLGSALIRGLQASGDVGLEGRVLACAKHFVGDGATSWGTVPGLQWIDWWDGWGDTWQIDQGDARISESELRAKHLLPYRAAVDAGVMSVMASYNSWNGEKLHGHRTLLTDVLKGELGFTGFVVSDWMGIDQLAKSYEESVVAAINAGIDMVMVPEDWRRFTAVMTQATSTGGIPIERVDDAVRRILTAKSAIGLGSDVIEAPPLSVVGSGRHRELAAEAVRRTAVLLKNDRTLPLSPNSSSMWVTGSGAHDIGLQCGGWTVGWQGAPGPITEGNTLLDGLGAVMGDRVRYLANGQVPSDERAAVAIVCIAESPYAEGPGDCARPTASAKDRDMFNKVREKADRVILVIYSGRPLVIPEMIAQADAVVAAWLPGSEAAVLGELLCGLWPFEAKTPQPWPRQPENPDDDQNLIYPMGHGIRLPARSGTSLVSDPEPAGPGLEAARS